MLECQLLAYWVQRTDLVVRTHESAILALPNVTSKSCQDVVDQCNWCSTLWHWLVARCISLCLPFACRQASSPSSTYIATSRPLMVLLARLTRPIPCNWLIQGAGSSYWLDQPIPSAKVSRPRLAGQLRFACIDHTGGKVGPWPRLAVASFGGQSWPLAKIGWHRWWPRSGQCWRVAKGRPRLRGFADGQGYGWPPANLGRLDGGQS